MPVDSAELKWVFEPFILRGPDLRLRVCYHVNQLITYVGAFGETAKAFGRRVIGLSPADPRTVQASYNSFYEKGVPELIKYLTPSSNSIYLRFQGRPYYAGGYSAKRIQIVHILAAIRDAGARSVFEVGFGSGMNLVALALLEPELQLAGVEFTLAGATTARALAAAPPMEFLKFVGVNQLTDEQRAALRRINFICADGTLLPIKSKSFDMIFTNLALEQMGWNYQQALIQIRRVARRQAAFIEPFWECNNLMQRFYLLYKDYFRDSWRHFSAYGFTPLSFSSEVPAKHLLHSGVLICHVNE